MSIRKILLRCLAAPVLFAALLCLNARAQDCPPSFQPPSQAEISRLARDARDRGFLWRIDKDGVTSYLYGTLHAQKLAWFGMGPRLRQALQAAKALALEMDPTDPEVRRQISAPPAPSAPGFTLPEPLRQRLRARMKAECVDPPALRALSPPLQLTTLSLLDARRDGLEASLGSDPKNGSCAIMEIAESKHWRGFQGIFWNCAAVPNG